MYRIALFLIGAAGGLVGDAAHVVSGTLTQLAHHSPHVLESAWWFPLLVGGATVAAGEVRLRAWQRAQRDAPETHVVNVARPSAANAERPSAGDAERPLRSPPDAIAAIAAIVGLYALTALAPDGPVLPITVVVWALAVLAWRTLGGATALAAAIGAGLAVGGTLFELVLVEADWFAYAEPIDALGGVPPWLPGLYFAFGAVASGLGPALASVPGRASRV